MKIISFITRLVLLPAVAFTVFYKLHKHWDVIKFCWRSEEPDVVNATKRYLIAKVELEFLYAESVARKILKVIVPILLFFLLFLL